MSVTTICLGNAEPIQYAKHPQPSSEAGIADLELWAEQVCGLDISGVPAVGADVLDHDGNFAFVCEASHRAEFLRELIAAPYQVPFIGGKQRTTFDFPLLPDGKRQDSLRECLEIISKNWPFVGKSAPGWIAGQDPFLVQVIADDLGITDIREWQPHGERGEFPNYGA